MSTDQQADQPRPAARPRPEPPEPTTGATSRPTGTAPAHEHRARVDLPEWMRNPTPSRRTPGRLASELLDRLPMLREARRSLWRWRDRTRLTESHPVVTVVVFLATATGTIALVGWFFYWMYLTLRDTI
jgi:hypothetical protein